MRRNAGKLIEAGQAGIDFEPFAKARRQRSLNL
jgi:hypothetical protein